MDDSKRLKTLDKNSLDELYNKVSSHINKAKQQVQSSINNEMIIAYWFIGQEIVEFEQSGKERAEYGKSILKELSAKLKIKYKKGFGVDLLERARKFYVEYQLDTEGRKSSTVSRKSHNIDPNLSWSHYVELMAVSEYNARKFYQIETIKNNWSVRELRRQIGSLLYDRLAKSKDKEGLLQLVHEGQEINTPRRCNKRSDIFRIFRYPRL